MNDRYFSLSRHFLWLMVALLPCFAAAQTRLDSLPPIDSLSDGQINVYTQRLAAQAAEFTQVLSDRSSLATSRRSILEEQWNALKADSTTAKTVLDSVGALLKTAKSEEKTALRQQNQSTKTLELANKISAGDSAVQRKNLRKVWKEVIQMDAIVHQVDVAPKIVAPIAEAETKDKKREKKKKPAAETPAAEPAEAPAVSTETPPPPPTKPAQPAIVRTKKYDPAADVMLNPPALPCQMAVNTRDEFSGEIYRRTAPVELFRHSPAALKNFLQGKPNVLCEAAIASAGANVTLHLTFTINDPSPRKAFGKLEKSSQATLWFMDGTSYIIYNQQLEEGVQNPENQSYVYRVQYPLIAEVQKKMRRMELDKIRIAWSSGYEDYDVQYVQLLMQQARCLFD